MLVFAHARVHFRPICFSTPSHILNNTATTIVTPRSSRTLKNLPIVSLQRPFTNLHRNPNRMSETMRAVLIKDGKGPVENLYLGEAPKPAPKPNEVLVKVSPQYWSIHCCLRSVFYLTY